MPVLRVVILGSEDKRCLRSVFQNWVMFMYQSINMHVAADPFLAHSLDSTLMLITRTDFSTDPIILVLLLNPIFQPSKLFLKT